MWALNRAQRRKTGRPGQPTSRQPTAVRHASWADGLAARTRAPARTTASLANRRPPRGLTGQPARLPPPARPAWACCAAGAIPCGRASHGRPRERAGLARAVRLAHAPPAALTCAGALRPVAGSACGLGPPRYGSRAMCARWPGC
jgi:hypothetical protein